MGQCLGAMTAVIPLHRPENGSDEHRAGRATFGSRADRQAAAYAMRQDRAPGALDGLSLSASMNSGRGHFGAVRPSWPGPRVSEQSSLACKG